MRKTVLIVVANGVEDIETIGVVDVLRRAGCEVTIASVDGIQITTSLNVNIIADKKIDDCTNKVYDLIVLPGGMPGAEHLRDCHQLTDLLKTQVATKRLYAAICASPVVVLQYHGLLNGLKATCHPSMSTQLKNYDNSRVVVSQNCITSQGPGTALEFAIKLVELLFNKEKAMQIADAMVIAN